jgi:hypothetical protein
MEPLSQLDVQSPDHVSVITRDGRLTVSVTKDGASVTLGFPIKNVFNTTPPVPLQQQPAPQMMAVKEIQENTVDQTVKRPRLPFGNYKLDTDKVREIKLMLSDKATMNRFKSKQQAYEEIGRVYSVSYHTISNIHKGYAWNDVKI